MVYCTVKVEGNGYISIFSFKIRKYQTLYRDVSLARTQFEEEQQEQQEQQEQEQEQEEMKQ